ACLDKEQALPPFRQYLTNWIILNDFMEKLGYKQYVRISARVRLEIYWVMMQIQDSGQATAKNMQWLSKKAIIPLLNGKWNFNNCFTSKNWGWASRTSPYLELHLLQISGKSSKTWKNRISNRHNNNNSKLNSKLKWIRRRLCNRWLKRN